MAEAGRGLSEQTLAVITALQQNEVTERQIYLNLSQRVKKESDRATLRRIAGEEAKHAETWRRYTNKKLRPQWIKVWFYTLVSIILGYTFTIKIMEKGKGSSAQLRPADYGGSGSSADFKGRRGA